MPIQNPFFDDEDEETIRIMDAHFSGNPIAPSPDDIAREAVEGISLRTQAKRPEREDV